MNNSGKKLTALLIAAACTLAVPLAACNNTDTGVSDEYSVVLNYNDSSSRPRTLFVDKGESVKTPEEPVREGYRISGWTTGADGGEQVSFPYTPTADTVIYAQWTVETYEVVLNYDYNNRTENLTKEYGSTLEQPEEPERSGYFIYRWLTAEGAEIVFPYTVKRDLNLIAEWRSNSDRAVVTFDFNYDGAPAASSVTLVNEPLTERRIPTNRREGYVQLGWATSADATVPEITTENLPYTLSGEVTLYAVWDRGTYTVSFANNYTGVATNYIRQTVRGWDEVDKPADPTRSQDGFNFTFAGWYTSAMGGTPIEFPYTVTRTTTFYAHWISERVTPSRNIFDAEFTPIAADQSFPGYSGSGRGPSGGIQNEDGFLGSTSVAYPKLQGEADTIGHYVGYMFLPQLTLTFTIYSDSDVSNATLYARLATELIQNVVLSSADGDPFSYQFRVNGQNVNYGSISFVGRPDSGRSDQYSCAFEEFRIGNISLRQGENVIQLVTNNTNTSAGGTTQAFAPMVDYIRIDTTATLTWSPIYDNLYSFRGEW